MKTLLEQILALVYHDDVITIRITPFVRETADEGWVHPWEGWQCEKTFICVKISSYVHHLFE